MSRRQRRMRLSLLVLSLVAVFSAMGWYLVRQPLQEHQAPLSGEAAAPTARDQPVPSLDVSPVDGAARAPDPPRSTIPELQSRADAGDTEATFELGRLLLGCLHYTEVDAQTLEDELIDAAAADNPFLRAFTGQASNESAIRLLLDVHDGQAQLCEGRELPAQAARLPRGAAALDRAAQSGHAAAQLAWVQAFRQRWSSQDEVVRSAERVRVERDRARAYLQHAVAAKLPEALLAQSIAHRTGDLDVRDDARAVAYWRAWRHLGSPGAPLPAWLLADADRKLDQSLSIEQRQTADAMAQSLIVGFAR